MPYTFATLACFVATLVDRLGYDRPDVLGISWGGGLAQQLAFQNPRRCRRLVLVSTGTGMLMVPARLGVLSKMITPRRYVLLLLAGVGWSSLPSLPLSQQPALVLAGNVSRFLTSPSGEDATAGFTTSLSAR